MHELDERVQRILQMEGNLNVLMTQLQISLDIASESLKVLEKEKANILKDYFSKRSPSAVETLNMAEKAKQRAKTCPSEND